MRSRNGSWSSVARRAGRDRLALLVAPVVFLAVTAILMHLVLSRLIGMQREQIATLAAFGLTRGEIGGHYVKLAAVVLVCGAGLGTALGWWLGIHLTAM